MGINSSQQKKDEQIKGQMDERTKIRVVIENTPTARFSKGRPYFSQIRVSTYEYIPITLYFY